MAKFRVKSPDGVEWEVNAPDDATEEAVLRYAQMQFSAKLQEKPLNPTDEMNGPQKFLAGIGKAFVDPVRALRQMQGPFDGVSINGISAPSKPVPPLSQADIDEAKQTDAPLMGTGAGIAGNVAGNLASAVIPGGNSIKGATLIGAGMSALQPTATGESRLANTAIGAALGGGTQAVLGKVANAARGKLNAADDLAGSVKTATAKASQDVGYVIPPDQVNPTLVNRLLSGFSGGIKTQQAASVKNQPITNALVAQDFAKYGVTPETPLTPELFKSIRSEAGKVYDAVSKSGTIVADDAYRASLGDLGKSYQAIAQEFPELANQEIGKLSQALARGHFSAKSAVELTKKLRFDGHKNIANMDPEKAALGRAQLEASDAVEELIGRNLTAAKKPELLQAFQAARVDIAKAHTAENALIDAAGNISAQAIKKAGGKKPLIGGMRKVADFAEAFPKAAQTIDSSTKANNYSVVDALTAGLASGVSGNPAMMAGVFARPAVRGAILSQPYQKMMTNPGAGFITRNAPGILEDDRLRRLGLLAPALYAGQQ